MEIKKSPNFSSREGHKIEMIVVHISAGSLDSMTSWFMNTASQASSHYAVGKNGKVICYVEEKDKAWHAGVVYNPTSKIVQKKVGLNPNLYCVTPDTKILMQDFTWKKAKNLSIGDDIIGFDEESINKKRRYFKKAKVTELVEKIAPVYQITLSDGTILNSTGEHKWLFYKGKGNGTGWIRTDKMEEFKKSYKTKHPLYLNRYFSVEEKNNTYAGGFLSASFDGEGSFHFKQGEGLQLTFTQKDNKMFEKVKKYLDDFNFTYGICRNKKNNINTIYLTGGKQEVFKFLMKFNPPRLIERFIKNILEKQSMVISSLVEVIDIKFLGDRKITAFSSSSKTYIAEGFGSHNTVGIECEGFDLKDAPEAQRKALYSLISDICKRNDLPINRDTIVGHYEIATKTRINDPSTDKTIMDKIVENVKILNGVDEMVPLMVPKSKVGIISKFLNNL